MKSKNPSRSVKEDPGYYEEWYAIRDSNPEPADNWHADHGDPENPMVERDSSIRVHGYPPNMATRWLHFSGILGRVTTKRRGWGEGSIYHRPTDGQWVGTVELGRDHLGRRRRRVVYARTKREVLDKLDRARSDKRQGLEPIDQRLTTGQWLDQWLSVHCDDLSAGSMTTYRQAVKWYIRPEVGHIQLAKLNPAHVEKMGRDLRQRGLSANRPSWRTASSEPPSRSLSGTASSIATLRPSPLARGVTTAPRPTTC